MLLSLESSSLGYSLLGGQYSLPLAKEKITPENIGGHILQWLHDFNLEVKKLEDGDWYFLMKVTTDGGKVIGVGRNRKHYSNHLTIRESITLSDQEKAEFAALSQLDKARLALVLQIELGRAVMGYSAKNLLEDGCVLFKHVPITASLNEETLVNSIWEMEAMLTILFCKGALILAESRSKRDVLAVLSE